MGESTKARQLWQCLHAKYGREFIRCAKGHELKSNREVLSLAARRGEPLIYKACQDCLDYEEMGPRLAKGERGWYKMRPANAER